MKELAQIAKRDTAFHGLQLLNPRSEDEPEKMLAREV